MTWMITSFFGAGYLKPAPGTWGSLAAIPAGLILWALGGPVVLITATLLCFAIGTWAVVQETRGQEDHDPSEIVIDEVVGQWIALTPALYFAGSGQANIWLTGLAAFGLFRAFDILKPGPVGWADRRNDATGVMLDDVIAGLLAALVITLAVVLLG